MTDVARALAAPEGWTDSPQEEQLRRCLEAALDTTDPVDRLVRAGRLIQFLRDQALAGVSVVRRDSAVAARQQVHRTSELVELTGLTRPTLTRLLQEGARSSDD